mmetsp:Transcript_90396/g.124829  ORF Transcript_90396/g.124829 Transcript_90396/m.124829 type:complete len:122 (+) Transcript_90396:53-418(+)
MSNLFKDYKVGLKFDLKGSYQGRQCLRSGQSLFDENVSHKIAYKDNDFRKDIKKICFTERITKKKTRSLLEILKTDSEFFDHTRIIDYSLLVGEIITEDVADLRTHFLKYPEQSHGVYFSE